MGECLLLGRDMAFDVDIEGLSQDTMRLEAELVEVRAKRTLPVGEIGHDAFGNVPVFVDHGTRRQGILPSAMCRSSSTTARAGRASSPSASRT